MLVTQDLVYLWTARNCLAVICKNSGEIIRNIRDISLQDTTDDEGSPAKVCSEIQNPEHMDQEASSSQDRRKLVQSNQT